VTGDATACAEVLLDLGARSADRRLLYRVPEALRPSILIGVRVLVPLGPGTAHGFVIASRPCDQAGPREIREILAVSTPTPLFSERLLGLAQWVADQTLSTLLEAVHCLVPPEVVRGLPLRPPEVSVAVLGTEARAAQRMGARQTRILAALQSRGEVPVDELVRVGGRPALRRLVAHGTVVVKERPGPVVAGAPPTPDRPPPDPPSSVPGRPTLVWGDTEARGAWFMDATTTAVAGGGQVLITVPEIARIPDLLARVRAALGDRVVGFHSGLSERERRTAWGRIVSGEVDAVIGTRSSLFAPLDRVRLIIVDEEQDPAYKADGAPRYRGGDVALHRGAVEGAQVVLGSATPSVETYSAVASGRMDCVRLAPVAPPPHVTVVDMRSERRKGHRGFLSQPLLEAIHRHLRSGGRVVLFVNRAGYAPILLCQECGHAVRCPRCEVALPYDRKERTMSCRICGCILPAPAVCPRCGGVALRWIGAGTERVEEVVGRLFPALRIARMDRETAAQFERVAGDFASGRVRMIVGTQLLLRAHHLRPSLVGVLDADLLLHRPDFRAVERAWQQLQAVVSLLGSAPGEAVVQTRVPDHPVIAALATGNAEIVYESELAVRREFGYPPYAVLARVIATSADRKVASMLAEQAAEIARACGVEVLGPAPARDGGARTAFRYHCLLRAPEARAVRTAARAALDGARAGKRGRLGVEMDL
jgi:primosomal protein N' (replication factor Y)